MSKKIMGVTVGTSLSPSKIEEKIKPIKTVNNVAPDENGNVEIKIPEGANGKTPYIQDGYWYIDGVNTNVKAEGKDGKDGTNGVDGKDYVLTEADKTEIAKKVADGGTLPAYWENYLPDKISAIRALQDEGGKDCFSFVVLADMHYPANLGKNSPILAKRIMDNCAIKYALCLGDAQTRGCHNTKEQLLAENEQIDKMLSPIRDRLLQTEGNHEGAYGRLDRDGNGISNTDSNGNLKPPAERETYVYNLTPAEMHSAIYRKVGLVGDVHFDESGSGYYIDDTANRVRYIVLNTQCNAYELQEDGTVKYPKMWIFRFTQSQFDLVIEALNNIPSVSWGVVVAGHCPLTQEIGDRTVMQGVLKAYKDKTTYSGTYAGTAVGKAYTNLAEPLPDNTTDTEKWVNGYRFQSNVPNISKLSGKTISNRIYCKNGDIIRIKGVSLVENSDRVGVQGTASEGTDGYSVGYFNAGITAGTAKVVEYLGLADGVYTFKVGNFSSDEITSFRFVMDTPTNPNAVIVTVNEEIIEGSVSGYDAVSVDVDFTGAKGALIGYFHGHLHSDSLNTANGFPIIGTRSDAVEEYTEELRAERIAGTTTEQSFDVFTVNKATRTIHATKIGAGIDREISY